MDISVLLTTYGREKDCKICLSKLLEQNLKELKVEIILLDDWHLYNKSLEQFCIDNNIKYLHTGKQKNGKVLWRVPGYALNIGAKRALGNYYIIGCAEIYYLDNECIHKMYKTGGACSPLVYDQRKETESLSNYSTFPMLDHKLPFCYGVPANIYHHIGGYDEDFTGYCFDDNDFSDRVQKLVPFTTINSSVIHLWQVRGVDNRGPNINQASWYYNQKLYQQRKNILVRNVDKDWGKF